MEMLCLQRNKQVGFKKSQILLLYKMLLKKLGPRRKDKTEYLEKARRIRKKITTC
jgi:hypothetical protein